MVVPGTGLSPALFICGVKFVPFERGHLFVIS